MAGLTRRGVYVRIGTTVLGGAVLLTACINGKGGGDPQGGQGGSFATDPPVVRDAVLTPTASGSVLAVTFDERDTRVKEGVPLTLEDRQITLRDNGKDGDERAGDGVFSAVVPAELADFEARAKQLMEAKSEQPIPVFEGRQLISRVNPKEVQERLRRVDLRRRIPLIDFWRGAGTVVDPARSLMIIHPDVVADPTRTTDPCAPGSGNPMGVWTFGHLMTEMANQSETGIDPSVFTRKWLEEWLDNQVVNTFTDFERDDLKAKVIVPWETLSGGPHLDLSKSPFKLVAIVNRVDLRDNAVYGGASAGEGRFVFGVVDRTNRGCQMMPFGVIFEYGINKRGCKQIRGWARQWVNLSTLALGSPPYNAALENITEQFVKAGANPSKLPNKSALNQLRSNEIALASPWELREFVIRRSGADAGFLQQDTVKNEPHAAFNKTQKIADYVNANGGGGPVPVNFPAGQPYLGAAAPAPTTNHFWDGPAPAGSSIANKVERFNFSLGTCSGCHTRETRTQFLHIDPATSPATLSGFLTGINDVDDPADPPTKRDFGDLARRAIDLDQLANSPCILQIFQRPLKMTH